jgi:D-3-phosphoglycerate dehydrogenase
LFLRDQPRIVLLDNFRIDALPAGCALVMLSRDVPGVMGQVGTLLGKHGVNIAHWHMGRDASGERQLSFINIDTPAGEPVMAELRAQPTVLEVQQVML